MMIPRATKLWLLFLIDTDHLKQVIKIRGDTYDEKNQIFCYFITAFYGLFQLPFKS